MADNWWQSLSFNSCSLQVMKILEIICGSSRQRYSIKKGVVKNFAKFTGKNLLTKILAQAFSCEFCEIPKNTFSYRTPPVAASVFARG